jgi:cysteine desulfurase / selenocysteine lyase
MNDYFAQRRQDFPMLSKKMHGHPLIYFDSAATAQKPQCMIDALQHFYQNHYSTVHRAVYGLATESTTAFNRVREQVRRFINAPKSEQLIFTRGTTESINLVAASFGKAFISAGDQVLISAMEHHSNIVPWQMICQERQAVLKVIPLTESGELDLEALRALLTPRTKLVAVSHVSNVLGTVNPIKQICALAHQVDAKVLVDGAQAVPHMRIDVQDLDADFYVFSGHKLFGPTGVGILYGKEELLEAMPPYQGGGDMIAQVTFDKTSYNVLPQKFEAGTPMIAEVIGLGASLDYLDKIGMEKIASYEGDLLQYAMESLKQVAGLRVIGQAKERGALISFAIDGVHPLDLATLLDLKGVALRSGHLCAQPLMQQLGVTALSRISFAFYNTHGEIDRFMQLLNEVRAKL